MYWKKSLEENNEIRTSWFPIIVPVRKKKIIALWKSSYLNEISMQNTFP